MITSDEMVFVWYDFEGTFDEMITECEKRVAKNMQEGKHSGL